MSRQRGYFMLMGGLVAMPTYTPPPPSNECDPYTRPHHLAASINLTELLVRLPNDAANVTLCEEIISPSP